MNNIKVLSIFVLFIIIMVSISFFGLLLLSHPDRFYKKANYGIFLFAKKNEDRIRMVKLGGLIFFIAPILFIIILLLIINI